LIWKIEQSSIDIEAAVQKSKDQGLNPQQDEDGIWYANTRVNDKSNVKFQPMILTKQSDLLKKYLIYLHNTLMHPSIPTLWAHAQRNVWCGTLYQMCKNVTKTCVKCRKQNPNFFTPIMADLPESRVSMDPPFTNVSIDYCGPFLVYEKRALFASPSESFILIIICHSTKAVHTEIVQELNVTYTLAAIYRFISRRGSPKSILFDSAAAFVSIQNAIKGQTLSRSVLTDWNALKNTEWRLTPGNSPHMNGLAVLCVKSLKKD
jgi:Integrase zinc binding domain